MCKVTANLRTQNQIPLHMYLLLISGREVFQATQILKVLRFIRAGAHNSYGGGFMRVQSELIIAFDSNE